ncbi:MAG: tRNA pseudouridine(38-40) synthase TruA [Firmicutes bacterium]|nr:tRNA pseudouridine(38-40) synthase TruA [Bacillota bacterium]
MGLKSEVRNIKLTLTYDGSSFAGFQIQPAQRTVQGELIRALTKILAERPTVIAAGRTDAGVHARGQVVTFKTRTRIPVARMPAACNSVLPRDMGVWQAQQVPLDFHARNDASCKIYRYLIHLSPIPSPFIRGYSWRIPFQLDLAAMREAAAELTGRHDFTAFCAAGSKVKSKVRTVKGLNVVRLDDLLIIDAAADGFLYKMLRSIVGTLVEVGRGALTARQVRDILTTGDRTQVGPTAPPQGLNLWEVRYDQDKGASRPAGAALTLPWGYVKISL